MGVEILQDLLENEAFPNCLAHVDVIKLARNVVKPTMHQLRTGTLPKYSLVLDGECCLDRLYGGFYSDWVCGGQWNRMVQFMTSFIEKINENNIDIVIFFNGGVESQRINEWIVKQKEQHIKATRILKHIGHKGTPPPKAWWFPPVGLHLALRTILRHNNVNLVLTVDDHHQEVIVYCRESAFHGLLADHADYVAFDPPKLFSAKQIKLTYKGFLISKEYVVSELMNALNINTDKLCVLTALLGNHILSDEELKDVYQRAGTTPGDNGMAKVKKLAQFLENITVAENLTGVASAILNSESDSRCEKLKLSIQYYLDGTQNGFLNYGSGTVTKRRYNKNNVTRIDDKDLQEPDVDTTKLASESTENEDTTIKSYEQNTANDEVVLNGDCGLNSNGNVQKNESPEKPTPSTSNATISKPKLNEKPVLPSVAREIITTVGERHTKGLMSPLVNQILSQGEIKLPVLLEDFKEIPNIHAFYKPVRQMIYAIMFNLNHHKFLAQKNKSELNVDIRIKEWTWSKKANKPVPEYVKAEALRWGVPTIQRLWFGTTVDDKKRRIRAYLSCMRSDTQLMMNTEYVPQHLLIVASVLRYIMSFPEKKVLRRPELDAFIITAISPELVNQEFTQEVQIPSLTTRGIQLAALFMQGVQTALLANDACGSPIPWLMSCPWLFFDGKLFQYIYYRAGMVKNLNELCEGRVDLIVKADHMRQAILDGLEIQFARPVPLYSYGSSDQRIPPAYPRQQNIGYPARDEGTRHNNRSGFSRPPLGSASNSRYGNKSAGQLEVGGVVVGQWGSNFSGGPSKSSLFSPAGAYNSTSYLLGPQANLGGGYGSGYAYRAKGSFLNRSALSKGRNATKPSIMAKRKTIRKLGKSHGSGATKNDISDGISTNSSNEENLNVTTTCTGGDASTADKAQEQLTVSGDAPSTSSSK